MTKHTDQVAVITGASRGLGKALATELAQQGWQLLLTARGAGGLASIATKLGATALPGDVTDPAHRRRLRAEAQEMGGARLLVNNASSLGPAPLPTLADFPIESLPTLFDTNVIAPAALTQELLPQLRAHHDGAIINISSDAATGPYPGWSGYGATKAALDQMTRVLGAEEPGLGVWSLDPGEMRTGMLTEAAGPDEAGQAAEPESFAVPAITRLLNQRPPSGRHNAGETAGVGA